ncbi:MAG TPA: hypothetical protein VNZ52_12550 [Candidatus Thermoplasmatota archaeon]|nr:hypothetical protein [Candidatus Thermoplasmatota archaeon]
MDLTIRRPPESVRAWWTDLPDDYHATDPEEQPYRIRTLHREDARRQLLTYWRNPDGSTMELRETMTLRPDGSWAFDIEDAMGVRIHDEFRAEPQGDGGTLLHIESTLTPKGPEAVPVAEYIMADMREGWPRAAHICERDAPGL